MTRPQNLQVMGWQAVPVDGMVSSCTAWAFACWCAWAWALACRPVHVKDPTLQGQSNCKRAAAAANEHVRYGLGAVRRSSAKAQQDSYRCEDLAAESIQ